MKLADFSIRRPKFTIVVMIILILLGAVSLTRLPLQLLPNVQPPVAAVATTYQGAGPEEVMQDVTRPLEAELSTVSGLTNISSQSQESSSIVILEFGYDMTIDEVENEITRTIGDVDLPEQAGEPSFLEFDITMFPSMTMAVTSENESVSEFQGQVDDLISELENINGVASISETGNITEEISVTLDTEALEQYQLSQSDVAGIIEANNISIPNATIVDEEAGESITTRTVSSIDGVESLQQLTLLDLPENGGTVTLDDVADVAITEVENDVITRLNQEDAMQIDMSLSSDANASTVNAEFRSVLEEQLAMEEFENLTVETLYDEGEYIDVAINSVYLSLISGAILAMVVLFAFLRNLKSPLIIGIAIPFSVITTFALLFFTDISINMMTLGGLALGIGMLVDNAVVVIENIYRHLSMGKSPKQAASDGAKEVAGAITASTMTTAAVFLPVIFVSGLVGQLFTPFAITVVFSLLASLFVALTVVPMLSSRILKPLPENAEHRRQNRSYMKGIRKLSRWTLAHRMLVLFLTAVILVAGAAGIYLQGINLLPESDEGALTVEVTMPQDAILSDTEQTVQRIEEKLEEYSEVDFYMSTIGSGSTMSPVNESNVGSVMVTLVDPGERNVTTNEFISEIENEIENVNTAAEIGVNPVSQTGTGSDPNTLTLNVADENSERLVESEQTIIEALEEDSRIESVASSREDSVQELQVRVDRAAARENGLQPAEIGTSIYEATNGISASTVDEGSNFLTINVKYPESVTSSLDAFENIQIANGQGEYIPIGDVSEFQEAETLPLINRDDQRETSELTVSYDPQMSLNEAGSHVQSILDDTDFSDETETSIGGDLELLTDAIPQLALAVVLGIVFIYLVMVAQFESFKHPFVVLFSLPLSIIGVMFSLIITNNPLSVIAVVGFILLLGIVVNNAILLIDYINQQKEKGMPTLEAIEKSVQDRFRPIVITALTTALGMLPLAIGIGEGAELVAPMGIVVIGGLVSSTFLTLFIIPIIYSYFDSETSKMNKKYMTPDGDIITQKEIDAQKREEEKNSQSDDYGYSYSPATDDTDYDAPKVQEEAPSHEKRDGDADYIEELKQLLDRMKEDRRK
ncbi:efflux RND transporter permease subunit [Salinicoccus sp. ID82-1]|uniref:efflux RND transporter permease subunit n=1 Tax=Salinicoccus sp. ID82-1 TaxID=2820269 RepID=UPI001F2CE76A|nr:efflux RND transporter permease subunit [Salinicoccus sp. ID82-1]MCG1010077.1 efflux RND transporter permease subunit [Salinicoccus sp. ID82-1]